MRQRDGDFKYTTIQLNKGYAARLHVDGNNHGPSYIIAMGDFTGGQLWIYDGHGPVELEVPEGGLRGYKHLKPGAKVQGTLHDVKNRWLQFDGRVPHCAMDFRGERYSLVFFSRSRFEHLANEHRERLQSNGFPLPTAPFAEAGGLLESLRYKAPPELEGDDSDEEEEGLIEALSQHEASSWIGCDWAQQLMPRLHERLDGKEIGLAVSNVDSLAPFLALQELLPKTKIRLTASCHNSKPAARYLRTFQPKKKCDLPEFHIFESMPDLGDGSSGAMSEKKMCFFHRQFCQLRLPASPQSCQDYFVGSFMAAPLLSRAVKSKTSSRSGPSSLRQDIEVFLSMRDFIERRKPRLAVLEIRDLEHVPPRQRPALMQLLLEESNDTGLGRLLTAFAADFIDVELPHFGIPLKETRVHIVLVRKDTGSASSEVRRICHHVLLMKQNIGAPTIHDFVFQEGSAPLRYIAEHEWKPLREKNSESAAASASSMKQEVSLQLRQLRGRPLSEGSQLYTEKLAGGVLNGQATNVDADSAEGFGHLTEVQKMRLNVAYEHADQTGLDLGNLVVDLNQDATAGHTGLPWRDDGLLPATGRSRMPRVLFSFRLARCLTGLEELQCYGVPTSHLRVKGLTDAAARKIASSAMAVPAIGCTLAAALALQEGILEEIGEPERSGLAHEAMQAMQAMQQEGSGDSTGLQARAAALYSVVCAGGKVENLSDANQKVAQELMDGLKRAKADKNEVASDFPADDAEEKPQPLITSEDGEPDPLVWGIRLRKIKFGPKWPWSAIFQWVKEASEDPDAEHAYDIMEKGIRLRLHNLEHFERLDEKDFDAACDDVGALSDAIHNGVPTGFHLAEDLDAAVMLAVQKRMQRRSKTGVEIIKHMRRHVKGPGWKPRMQLLDFVAKCQGNGVRCQDVGQAVGGWKTIVQWLREIDAEAEWPEEPGTLMKLSSQAEDLIAEARAANQSPDKDHAAFPALHAAIFQVATARGVDACVQKVSDFIIAFFVKALAVAREGDEYLKQVAEFAEDTEGSTLAANLTTYIAACKRLAAVQSELTNVRGRQQEEALQAHYDEVEQVGQMLVLDGAYAELTRRLKSKAQASLEQIQNNIERLRTSKQKAQHEKDLKIFLDTLKSLRSSISNAASELSEELESTLKTKMKQLSDRARPLNEADLLHDKVQSDLEEVRRFCQRPGKIWASKVFLCRHGFAAAAAGIFPDDMLEDLRWLASDEQRERWPDVVAQALPYRDSLIAFLRRDDIRSQIEALSTKATDPPQWRTKTWSFTGLPYFESLQRNPDGENRWEAVWPSREAPLPDLHEDIDTLMRGIDPMEEVEAATPANDGASTIASYVALDDNSNAFCTLCRRSGRPHLDSTDHATARDLWEGFVRRIVGWQEQVQNGEIGSSELWSLGLCHALKEQNLPRSIRAALWERVLKPHVRVSQRLESRNDLIRMFEGMVAEGLRVDRGSASQAVRTPRVARGSVALLDRQILQDKRGELERARQQWDSPANQRRVSQDPDAAPRGLNLALINFGQYMRKNFEKASQADMDAIASAQNSLRRHYEAGARRDLAKKFLQQHQLPLQVRNEALNQLHDVDAMAEELQAAAREANIRVDPNALERLRGLVRDKKLSEVHLLPRAPEARAFDSRLCIMKPTIQ